VRGWHVSCVAADIAVPAALWTGGDEGEKEGKGRVVRPVSWRVPNLLTPAECLRECRIEEKVLDMVEGGPF